MTELGCVVYRLKRLGQRKVPWDIPLTRGRPVARGGSEGSDDPPQLAEGPLLASTACIQLLRTPLSGVGLPDVPDFPGRPGIEQRCPASRQDPSRDVKCPVFCTRG
jgi:hypothetical protein